MLDEKKISIIGTKGIPARYGGFETFVEYYVNNCNKVDIIVYCDKSIDLSKDFYGCQRIRIPISANGIQGILYDIICIIHSIIIRRDILLLGCSGALAIPLARLFNVKVTTNIAGLEWSRSKWSLPARFLLKFFEKIAVLLSNNIISDNNQIQNYISDTYQKSSHMIAYGGDHVLEFSNVEFELPFAEYFFSMARCQPDNNIEVILDSFINLDYNIIFVSNFSISNYGKYIKDKYKSYDNILLMDAIYDIGKTNFLRRSCIAYIHGHSAGGTNPVLVESMMLGCACICYDNGFNNYTTNFLSLYFKNSNDLQSILLAFSKKSFQDQAYTMHEYAKSTYRWESIINLYNKVLFND